MGEKHHKTEEQVIKSDKMRLLELTDELKRSVKEQVVDALVENNRVQSKAADMLGISRQLLNHWIKIMSIDISRLTPEKHSQWADENYEALKQFR